MGHKRLRIKCDIMKNHRPKKTREEYAKERDQPLTMELWLRMCREHEQIKSNQNQGGLAKLMEW